MAKAAGIAMSECRLLEEGGRAHFMTRRFDREGVSTRHHIQTLCAMAHMDFGMAGAYSYGQLFEAILKLGLPDEDLEQAFRRMVFNVLARNLDDHTKNVSFRLRQGGRWELAPAYDLTFAHNPEGRWNHQHFLSVNGRHEGIGRDDILVEGERYSIGRARAILDEVRAAVDRWTEFGDKAGVSAETASHLEKQFVRL
jgi:serine/threonine-protein kinase HipA